MFESRLCATWRTVGACRRVPALALASLVIALPRLAAAQIDASQRPAALDTAPLTLSAVIAATRTHPLVVAAERRMRAARGARLTAGTIGNPIFTYQVENTPFPGRENTSALIKETSTLATLPLEFLWQRGPRVGRADEEIRATEAELMATRRQVALDAARAFHRSALAQASVSASGAVVAGLDSLIRYTGARVREGATAEGDLLRLEVERERALTEQALQEAELAQAHAALSAYLADSTASLTPSLARMAVRVAEIDWLTDLHGISREQHLGLTGLPARHALAQRALALRPDIVAARARTRAASAEVGLQRTLTVRQLGATFGNKSIGGAPSMIAGLSIPVPLFDRNRGGIQRAAGERAAVEQELRWAERRAASEVVGAYDAASTLTVRVTALQAGYLARAEESNRVALAAYREGAASLLQVLDATRTLAEARLTYLRARYAQQDAVLFLYVAAGFDPADALSTSAAPLR